MMQMRNNVKRLKNTLSIYASVILLTVSASEGLINNTTGPTGLTGSSTALPGDEVLIYSVGLTEGAPFPVKQNNLGSGVGVPGIEITISDLTAATGLVAADFTGLNLYKSTDNVFDGGDTQILNNVPANVGAVTQLDVTGLPTGIGTPREIPTAGETFFFITAVISPTATPGHTFRVGAINPHIGIFDVNAPNNYDVNPALVTAADGNNIVIGSSNQSSSFLNGQAGGGRGIPFGGEPVMLVLLIGTGLYMIRRQLV